MGGSSLAPLVFATAFGLEKLLVLDSTDPEAVKAMPTRDALYVISSKSGSTIEPNCFADWFWHATDGDGSSFVAKIHRPGQRPSRSGSRRTAGMRSSAAGPTSAAATRRSPSSAWSRRRSMGQDVAAIIGWSLAMLAACEPGPPSAMRNPARVRSALVMAAGARPAATS